jgi:thiamine biosynthesis lipoprotein ApbE
MNMNVSNQKHGEISLQNGSASIQITAKRPDADLAAMVNKCGQLMKDVERFLHGRVANSDTQRLSMCGHLAPMVVHPWTYDALLTCLPHCQASQGFTDITYESRESLRKCRNHQPSAQTWEEAGAWKDLTLLEGNQVLLLRPLRVELGDLVAAYCVDKASAHLSAQRSLVSATVSYGCYERTIGKACATDSPQPTSDLHPARCLRPGYFLNSLSGLLPVRKMQHPRTGKNLGTQKSLSVFSRTCMEAGLLSRTLLRAPQTLWENLIISYESMAVFVSKNDERYLFPVPK